LKDVAVELLLGAVEVIVVVVFERLVDAIVDLIVVDVDLDDRLAELTQAVLFELVSGRWTGSPTTTTFLLFIFTVMPTGFKAPPT